jgi:hypothetical protein
MHVILADAHRMAQLAGVAEVSTAAE